MPSARSPPTNSTMRTASKWALPVATRSMVFKTRSSWYRFIRRIHPAWVLVSVLTLYLLLQPACPPPIHDDDIADETSVNSPTDHLQVLARRASAAKSSGNVVSTELGNKFCILQPTLSVDKGRPWTVDEAQNHIALRAFMRTFAETIEEGERKRFKFAIYYGYDSTDPVFGNPLLRRTFDDHARGILRDGGFALDEVQLVYSPMYGLHGRINAIWNFLAKDAYYDGCDYFFMSNDDMVFFTKGWVARATDSLAGIGSVPGHKRPCRNLGIVRFKDEWASWATFTFHVSTRLHMEIFGGVYYPVPYNSAHNDYWIHYVYGGFQASKYRGEVKVRNRVEDVDFALAHQKDTKHIAPARYKYDKLGDARKYILEGRAHLKAWLEKYKNTEYCKPPL